MPKIIAFPKMELKVTAIYTEEERNALAKVIDIVDDLLELEDGQKLVSPMTGEVIGIEELPRVIGILDGLLTNSQWNLE